MAALVALVILGLAVLAAAGIALTGRPQPATETDESLRAVAAIHSHLPPARPVPGEARRLVAVPQRLATALVSLRPTWVDRARGVLGLLVVGVLLGVAVALLAGLVVLVLGRFLSTAIG